MFVDFTRVKIVPEIRRRKEEVSPYLFSVVVQNAITNSLRNFIHYYGIIAVPTVTIRKRVIRLLQSLGFSQNFINECQRGCRKFLDRKRGEGKESDQSM